MKFRTVIEAVILALFLTSALAATLWYNKAVPDDAESDKSAREYVLSGDQLYAAGRPKFNEAAVNYWEAIKQDTSDTAGARFRLAAIYYYNGWNYQPLRLLEELERIDPQYPGLYLLLGKIHDSMQNTDKAFSAFQKAVAAQPDIPEVHYYLGTTYQQKNMPEEAISEYKKAIKASLKTGSPDAGVLKAHLQLGRIYKGRADYEKAEAEFKEALKIDSAHAEVLSDLRGVYNKQAEYHKRQREYDRAMEKYGEILKINPDNPRNLGIYMELGDRYVGDGLYYKAAEMYESARKLDPMNFEVFKALIQVDILKGMSGEEEQIDTDFSQ